MEARRVRRNLRKLDQRQERKVRIAKWHKQFAWRPLKISTPSDPKHTTIVWFETVIQKGRVVNDFGISNDMPQFDKIIWTRHTEKEYFRKKLDGTLEKEEQIPDFENFTHDGTDMNIRGAGAAGVTSSKTQGPSAGPPK